MGDTGSIGHTQAAPPTWRAVVITLLPEMFPGPLVGSALSGGTWSLETVALRGFGHGRHRVVDDPPTGGGAGMGLRPGVVAAAIDHAAARHQDLPLLYPSPRGRPLTQARVRSLSEGPGAILVAGRFEGLDQRVIDARGLEEVSIGDFVLSGGEIAAMALIDACVRLLPGVLGAAESLREESFEDGLLEYPLYTKPRIWDGRETPEILLSGDHGRIARWRREQAEQLTRERRPDLWSKLTGGANAAKKSSTTNNS